VLIIERIQTPRPRPVDTLPLPAVALGVAGNPPGRGCSPTTPTPPFEALPAAVGGVGKPLPLPPPPTPTGALTPSLGFGANFAPLPGGELVVAGLLLLVVIPPGTETLPPLPGVEPPTVVELAAVVETPLPLPVVGAVLETPLPAIFEVLAGGLSGSSFDDDDDDDDDDTGAFALSFLPLEVPVAGKALTGVGAGVGFSSSK